MATWIINNGGNLHDHSSDGAGFGIDDVSFYFVFLDKPGPVQRWIIEEEAADVGVWTDHALVPWTN